MKAVNTRFMRDLLHRKVVNDSRLVLMDSHVCYAKDKSFKNGLNFLIFVVKY